MSHRSNGGWIGGSLDRLKQSHPFRSRVFQQVFQVLIRNGVNLRNRLASIGPARGLPSLLEEASGVPTLNAVFFICVPRSVIASMPPQTSSRFPQNGCNRRPTPLRTHVCGERHGHYLTFPERLRSTELRCQRWSISGAIAPLPTTWIVYASSSIAQLATLLSSFLKMNSKKTRQIASHGKQQPKFAHSGRPL